MYFHCKITHSAACWKFGRLWKTVVRGDCRHLSDYKDVDKWRQLLSGHGIGVDIVLWLWPMQIQYTDAMKAYHNSPAYQSWIAAKGKVDVDTESEEPEKTRRTSVSVELWTFKKPQRTRKLLSFELDSVYLYSVSQK